MSSRLRPNAPQRAHAAHFRSLPTPERPQFLTGRAAADQADQQNAILIHPDDAAKQGLATGDEVIVTSATNTKGEMQSGDGKGRLTAGRVCLTQTVRPGVVSFALGFGHWATGSADIEVNGKVIKGDPRRDTGIHANAAMWIDPALKNTCFLDPLGGSVNFYDTHIKLVKAPKGIGRPSKGILKAV